MRWSLCVCQRNAIHLRTFAPGLSENPWLRVPEKRHPKTVRSRAPCVRKSLERGTAEPPLPPFRDGCSPPLPPWYGAVFAQKLGSAVPHCGYCPRCQARHAGHVHAACKLCGGRGWLNRGEFEACPQHERQELERLLQTQNALGQAG